jgi:hypothetical protein
MAGSDGLRHRNANGNSKPADVITISAAGRERDAALDKHDRCVLYTTRSNHIDTLSQLRVRWPMGCICYHDGLSHPDVLPLGVSLVL